MKNVVLGLSIAALATACATTTSPTGRTQRVGAVSQEQLNQLGAQAFAQAKAKTPQTTNSGQTAYVRCVVSAITRELPSGWQARRRRCSPTCQCVRMRQQGRCQHRHLHRGENQDQLAAVIAHEIGHGSRHGERATNQMGAQAELGILGAIVGSAYGEALPTPPANSAAWRHRGSSCYCCAGTEAGVVGRRLMAAQAAHSRRSTWENMIAAL
jgi:hypothetical protein